MWVMFFVQGKSRAETHRWLPDDYSDDDIKAEAEEWAQDTSQGRLNDHYRFGFERVKKVPVEARAKLIAKYLERKKNAENMLAILAQS